MQVSGETGLGLDDLRDAIEARFLATLKPMELLVPYREGGTLSELHDLAGELEREDTAEAFASARACRPPSLRASSDPARTATAPRPAKAGICALRVPQTQVVHFPCGRTSPFPGMEGSAHGHARF